MSGIKSFEYYMERYQLGLSYTQNVKYDDPESVKRNNRGVDMYRKAARSIGRYHPDKIEEFASQLNQGDKEDRLKCATCILELMNADKAIRVCALQIIKDVARGGDMFEKFVCNKWLERNRDIISDLETTNPCPTAKKSDGKD